MIEQALTCRGTPLERFWPNVIKQSIGCWEWNAALSNGYGVFWAYGRQVKAARFAYEQAKGVIPEGLELDHLCRNKSCVNPDHLEAVTRSVNTLRGLLPLIIANIGRNHQLSKTHCPQGHPYDLLNTYFHPDGKRDCRICRQERSLKWRAQSR